MFKRVLIPTDGSPVSAKAVRAGIAFAKQARASVVGYHAVEPAGAPYYGDGYIPDRRMIAAFERRSREVARKHVGAVARAARKAGVPCQQVVETTRTPAEGIVAAARKRKCDLILLASHGRRGLMRLALGSVTDKVIQLSRVPVLVYR